ncbi:MAG: sigma-70 family RNA polymerase sigma factor [Alphaproteobacteria bacterium]|nr:sigma-70 family RNA polymerase sigma factor [Alphaproteobacteria bacterium]
MADNSENASLEQLMASAIGGDKRAYDLVLQAISSRLLAALSKKLPPKDRDDVVQEILLSVHKARHTYEPTRPLMPWVMAIARYRLSDYWRKHYGQALDRTVDIDDMKDILPTDVTKDLDTSEDIRRIMPTLPQKQQEILDLMYRQDKSVQEVAGLLNMTVSAVKVAAHRGYKAFRKRLKE